MSWNGKKTFRSLRSFDSIKRCNDNSQKKPILYSQPIVGGMFVLLKRFQYLQGNLGYPVKNVCTLLGQYQSRNLLSQVRLSVCASMFLSMANFFLIIKINITRSVQSPSPQVKFGFCFSLLVHYKRQKFLQIFYGYLAKNVGRSHSIVRI